jgi:small subunit ribosomal protein S14
VARLALRLKAQRPSKFKTRVYNRCPNCGRVRSFLRKFKLCRICFRFLSLRGEIPGVIKSSW